MAESTWAGIPFNKLTDQQLEFLKSIIQNPDKSFFLKGVAGSGKTVIAAHALSIMRKNTEKTVAFMVFTKMLKKFVSDGFSGIENEIFHFHDWYNKNRGSKDIFIIDECQDFEASWVDAVIQYSHTQIWLGDDSQQIYDNRTGFQRLNTLFKEGSSFELNVNYRNCLFVAKFAAKFIQLTESDKARGITLEQKINAFINPVLNNQDEEALSRNQPIVFIEAENRKAEIDSIAKIINDIMASKEASKKIAVAHFTRNMAINLEAELMQRGIKCYRRDDDASNNNLPDFNDNSFVLISPIHSLKGLEFDYIFFPRTEEDRWRDDYIFKNLLFVLFTRAKNRVYCSYVDKSKSYIYDFVKNEKNSDFFTFITANEVQQSGNPLKSEEEVEAIIKKEFDGYNI